MSSPQNQSNFYGILSLSRDANDIEIRAAFKKKALELHPDKNPNGEAAFKNLRRAYETLSDPTARKNYDAQLPRRNQSSHG